MIVKNRGEKISEISNVFTSNTTQYHRISQKGKLYNIHFPLYFLVYIIKYYIKQTRKKFLAVLMQLISVSLISRYAGRFCLREVQRLPERNA